MSLSRHANLFHLSLSAPSTWPGRADVREHFADLTAWLLILLLRARHKPTKEAPEHSPAQPHTGFPSFPAGDAGSSQETRFEQNGTAANPGGNPPAEPLSAAEGFSHTP